MRTKKVQKSRQPFRSVGMSVGNGADGHVSDMRDPSVLDVGNRADGHVSDMRDPSVLDVGNAVGNRADGHVSDMRATTRR